MTDTARFNYKVLLADLENLKNSIPSIDRVAFSETILEFVKIFDLMGSGLQIAFKDIIKKVGIVNNNFQRFPEIKGGFIDFVEFEKVKRIDILNGHNGDDKVPERQYKDYESTARTLLRLMWFFDFVTDLVSNLEAHRKMKVSEACKKAYDAALAPHHPFTIRTAAKTAMTFAPNREKLLELLFPAGTSEEEKYSAMQKMLELIEPTRKYLWEYYQQHNMTRLS